MCTVCSYLFQAGANMIVSGSAVISSDDPRSVIALLRTVVAEAIQKRSLDRWDVLFVEVPMDSCPPKQHTTADSATDSWSEQGASVELEADGQNKKKTLWVKLRRASASCPSTKSSLNSYVKVSLIILRLELMWHWFHTCKHSWLLIDLNWTFKVWINYLNKMVQEALCLAFPQFCKSFLNFHLYSCFICHKTVLALPARLLSKNVEHYECHKNWFCGFKCFTWSVYFVWHTVVSNTNAQMCYFQ